ncbi:MAG: transglutaminase-like domain-containing protein [Candidatus Woesebacteria bacterium]|nr:transglutaminase-like domain-containing protein [Candidatus Woesebacteria bacterium]
MNRIFKFFVFLFVISTLYYVLCTSVRAEGEFLTDFDVTYKVKDTGITEVNNKITLTNIFSNLYATSYSIVLDNINPTNIKAYDEKGPLEIIKNVSDKTISLQVKFANPVVGKDKSRVFWVSFEEPSFAIRTGEVWEVSIPRLSETARFASYYINLEVPESFGQEAYISPTPRDTFKLDGLLKYKFNKEDVSKTGITAGFGQFQVFSFSLSYHLENPLNKESTTEIALPPDTAFQKVYYSNLNPRPTNMEVDSDGNWIGIFDLKPRERVDVTATGYVQIFASQRPYPRPTQETLNDNLIEQTYWEINDPVIVNEAKKFKTAREIYDFVATKLKYDYERVKPNVERLGAVKALQNPDSAICMEFTDLFIALARAVGIPAREVNGFAYTENPIIQPLSLVNDVLHAWPEYYDYEKGVWIPVDPTWASTTGGVDYFNKLDLRHFTFVIHGKSSTEPYPAGSYKLGSNPQKDVFVSFGQLPVERNSKIAIKANLSKWIPLIANKLDIAISNPGPNAIYNITPIVYFDGVAIKSNNSFDILMPFQTYKTYIDIPFSFLGTKTPEKVRIVIEGEEIVVSTSKTQVIIYNLLFIFAISIVVLLTIIIRLKKWKFPKLNF